MKLAEELGTTPTKLALQFVTTRPFLVSNIIGATNIKQLEENIGSLSLILDEETLEQIEAIHSSFPNPSP